MKYKLILNIIYFFISCHFALILTSYATEDNVTARDGTFIAFTNGVVKDTKTELEWIAGPDKDVTWKEAQNWVKDLKVNGGGWRMPSKDELKTLYQKGAGRRKSEPITITET